MPIKRYLWEFAGPRGKLIAEHHIQHVREMLWRDQVQGWEVGVEQLAENRFRAWLTAPEPLQAGIEKALRPPKWEPVVV